MNKETGENRTGIVSRFVSFLQSLLKGSRENAPYGRRRSDRIEMQFTEPTDDQIESALVRSIWEDVITLPESITISRTVSHNRFSLPVMLSNIDALYSAIAEERGLNFTCSQGKDITGSFIGDQSKIGRILRNLIHSAFSHTDEGTINLTCIYRNGLFIASVSDTGIGIPQHVIRALHSVPVFEAGDLLPEEGLPLTNALCRILGGQIIAKSERQIGSIVTVTLPLQKAVEEQDDLVAGESIVLRWQNKYGNNPELAEVFVRGLAAIQKEITDLEGMLETGRQNEILPLLHSMKSFPGGFGLIEIHEKLKSMEKSAEQEPFDKKPFLEHLDDLKKILASIPDLPLPSQPDSSLNTADSDQDASPVSREDYAILVADDDRMNREMIEYVLRKTGVVYRFVGNGEEALQQLTQNRFDLLLLDICMPVMDGVEAISRIRTDKQFDSLHIIAMTAYDGLEKEANYRKLGCNDFISKPIDLNRLTEKITSVLAAKHTEI